jgi:hypothetical protein
MLDITPTSDGSSEPSKPSSPKHEVISQTQKLDFENWKDIATILYRVLYASAIMEEANLQLQIVAALGVYEDMVDKEKSK